MDKLTTALRGLLPGLALVLLAFGVGGWGDYPVNDDWQYAHVAKQLAETGHMRVDVAIAPSVVGQAALAYPFLAWLGFSHTLLRGLTLALACLCLFVLDRILAELDVSPGVRLASLLLLALTPLFAYLSLSFMTEIWGLAPGLVALWIWVRAARGRDDDLPPQWAIVAAAVLLGGAFWIRQLASLLFPALAGAVVLRRPSQVVRLIPGALVFGLLVWGYFAWSKATGNLRPEFARPMGGLLDLDRRAWSVELGAFVLYLTAFSLPLLVCLPWRGARPVAWAGGAALLGGVLWICFATLAKVVPHNHLHPRFPILTNLLYETGIGPITLAETPRHYLPGYAGLWTVVQGVLVGASLLWVPAGRWLKLALRDRRGRTAQVVLACLLLALGNLIFCVQAYKLEVFDRYHFPALVALSLALTIVVDRAVRSRSLGPWRLAAIAGAAAPLLLYTFVGLHDQFAWMSARATLYQRALAAGVSPQNLDAGYELNGWFAFVEKPAGAPPSRCRGACATRPTWYVEDDSHRIGFAVQPDHRLVEAIDPGLWMLPVQRVVWTERLGP